MRNTITVLLLISCIAPQAFAQTTAPASVAAFPRAYLGIGASQGRGELPPSTNPVGGVAATTSVSEPHSAGGKLYAGYRLNDTWGAELGYHQLGRKYATSFSTPAGAATSNSELTAWSFAATGAVNLSHSVSLLGKLGLARDDSRIDRVCVGTACTAPRANTHWGPVIGVGAEYSLASRYGLRLEYEDYGKFTVGDVLGTGSSGALRVSAWTASVQARF